MEGHIPKELPCGDVLVIAGASFPFSRLYDSEEQILSQVIYWDTILRPWLVLQCNVFDKILITHGYTDWLPYQAYILKLPEYLGSIANRLRYPDSVVDITNKLYTYIGKETHSKTINFFGSPWSYESSQGNYAFIKSEEALKPLWDRIPNETQVLVTHEAPLNCSSAFFGSKSLLEKTNQLKNLKYHIFGHSHSRVRLHRNDKIYVNCSYTEYSPGVLDYTNNLATVKFVPNKAPIETFIF